MNAVTTLDFAALANAVSETAPDANVAKGGGGGEYTPPAEGVARLRFVGYVEVGNRTQKVKNSPDKIEPKAWLIFELHGKAYPPRELEDGTKVPVRMTVKLNHSLNEKAIYYKLFQRMNYEGKAQHFSQLLGQGFLGTVHHFKFKDNENKDVVVANFKGPDGLTIRPPRVEMFDEESGEAVMKAVPVPEAISPLRLFVWNAKADHLKVMWDTLYIPGDEGKEGDKEHRTRNVLQAEVKKALNFEGSPIATLLAAGGEGLKLEQAADNQAARKSADDSDPLNDF